MKYDEDKLAEILALDEEVRTPGQTDTLNYAEKNDKATFDKAKNKAIDLKKVPKYKMVPPAGGQEPIAPILSLNKEKINDERKQ